MNKTRVTAEDLLDETRRAALLDVPPRLREAALAALQEFNEYVGTSGRAVEKDYNIPVDLEGWRYADEVDAKNVPGTLTLWFSTEINDQSYGEYAHDARLIIVYDATNTAQAVTTLEHELVHFVQEALARGKGFRDDSLGVPSGRLNYEERDIENARTPHPLRQIEFQPLLQDEIRRYQQEHPADLKKFIADSPFFRALRQRPADWQRATREFAKATAASRTANDDAAVKTLEWCGLPVSIEVEGGDVRFPGDKYETLIPEGWVGYGYFDDLPGDDGDSLDIIWGPLDDSTVYLAVQTDAEGNGDFVQWKVMTGFGSETEAEAGFRLLWPPSMFGGITKIDADDFKTLVLPKIVADDARDEELSDNDDEPTAIPSHGADGSSSKTAKNIDLEALMAQPVLDLRARPVEERKAIAAAACAAGGKFARLAKYVDPGDLVTSRRGRHAHDYPWGNFELEADPQHPHTSVPEPPVKNDQAVQHGESAGNYYRQLARNWGQLVPGQPTNLQHYDYRPHEQKIDDLIHGSGYQVYYAGGKYGKPDLANKNYNTGHLMVYDPTPGQGGDFGDEALTRSWRKLHEFSHAQAYKDLNAKYGEGRRIGKLGYHRTLREAKRAVEWEWMAAHKQREYSAQIGYPIDDATFAKELNTVLHDAVHRAVTGKFTNPDEEGFQPSDQVVPLEVAFKQLEDYARQLGLQSEDSLLTPEQRGRTAAADLAAAVDAFFRSPAGRNFASCRTVGGAFNNCDIGSEALAEWLHAQGFEAHSISVRGYTQPLDRAHKRWQGRTTEQAITIGHDAVLVNGSTVVDITARQFDARLPFPLIEPLEAYRARWQAHRFEAAKKDVEEKPRSKELGDELKGEAHDQWVLQKNAFTGEQGRQWEAGEHALHSSGEKVTIVKKFERAGGLSAYLVRFTSGPRRGEQVVATPDALKPAGERWDTAKHAKTRVTAEELIEIEAGLRKRLPPKAQLWTDLLTASGLPYPPDFVTADTAYRRWRSTPARARGPKPEWRGGETDALNHALQGVARAPVSGPYEAFELLTRNIADWDTLAASNVLAVLREVPGLETLRLPDGAYERALKLVYGPESEYTRRYQEELESEETNDSPLSPKEQRQLPDDALDFDPAKFAQVTSTAQSPQAIAAYQQAWQDALAAGAEVRPGGLLMHTRDPKGGKFSAQLYSLDSPMMNGADDQELLDNIAVVRQWLANPNRVANLVTAQQVIVGPDEAGLPPAWQTDQDGNETSEQDPTIAPEPGEEPTVQPPAIEHLKLRNEQLYERAIAAGAQETQPGTAQMGNFGWAWHPSAFGQIRDPVKYREILDELEKRVFAFEQRPRNADLLSQEDPRFKVKDIIPRVRGYDYVLPSIADRQNMQNYVQRVVPVAQIVSEQPSVMLEDLAGPGQAYAEGNLPKLVPQPDGHLLIDDGNHRITNAIMNGATEIEALVYIGPLPKTAQQQRDIVVSIPANKLKEIEAEEAEVAKRTQLGDQSLRYFWEMGRLPTAQPRRIYFVWDGAVRAYHNVLEMSPSPRGPGGRIYMDTTIHEIAPVALNGFRGFRYFEEPQAPAPQPQAGEPVPAQAFQDETTIVTAASLLGGDQHSVDVSWRAGMSTIVPLHALLDDRAAMPMRTDLPPGVTIKMEELPVSEDQEACVEFKFVGPHAPEGALSIWKGVDTEYWYVGYVHAEKGWGPLLYDTAMRYATAHGAGLAPDPKAVSEQARNVWQHYYRSRPDVEHGAIPSDHKVDELRHVYRQQAFLRPRKEPGAKAAIIMKIPSALARMWPKEDDPKGGPPHFTLAFVPGPHDSSAKQAIARIMTEVARSTAPIPVELAKGVHWFTSDVGDGEIAHKTVHPKTAERMTALHWKLIEALEDAGFDPAVRDEFRPHATLAYCESRGDFKGQSPEGGFTADGLELWGWDDTPRAAFGSKTRTTPEDVLGLNVEAAKRKRKDKRRRYAGETFFLPKGGWFAHLTRDEAGDDAEEIRLKPSARVLREGAKEYIALEGLSMEEVFERAREAGYDAVQADTRLAVINEDAIADRKPALRGSWVKA